MNEKLNQIEYRIQKKSVIPDQSAEGVRNYKLFQSPIPYHLTTITQHLFYPTILTLADAPMRVAPASTICKAVS